MTRDNELALAAASHVLVPSFDELDSVLRDGKVADAFGQPGGGTQWVVVDEEGKTVLISFLLDNGYLDWG